MTNHSKETKEIVKTVMEYVYSNVLVKFKYDYYSENMISIKLLIPLSMYSLTVTEDIKRLFTSILQKPVHGNNNLICLPVTDVIDTYTMLKLQNKIYV